MRRKGASRLPGISSLAACAVAPVNAAGRPGRRGRHIPADLTRLGPEPSGTYGRKLPYQRGGRTGGNCTTSCQPLSYSAAGRATTLLKAATSGPALLGPRDEWSRSAQSSSGKSKRFTAPDLTAAESGLRWGL